MRAGAAAGLEAADALLRREGPAVPAAAHQEPDRKHPAHVPGGYYIYIYIYIYILYILYYIERETAVWLIKNQTSNTQLITRWIEYIYI